MIIFVLNQLYRLKNHLLEDPAALLRYILVSIAGYGFAAGGLYWLSLHAWVDPRLGYALVYLVIYAVQYPVTIYFIYRVKHKTSNLFKYGVYLFLNWSVASGLYFVLSHLGLGIFQAFVFVAAIMFPLRFVFGKRVYR